jgi:hypothetical protein
MQIKEGPTKTTDGTEVVVDEYYPQRNVWIGHLKKLGQGHPQGVIVWNDDGSVANLGCSQDFREKMKLE